MPEKRHFVPRGHSIAAKWSATLLGVAIAPLLCVGIIGLRIQRQGLEGVERALEAAVVDEVGSIVVTHLRVAAEMTSQVGERTMDRRIRSVAGTVAGDVEIRATLAREIFATNDDVERIDIFDEAGRYVDGLKKVDGSDVRSQLPVAKSSWEREGGALVFAAPFGEREAPWFAVARVPLVRLGAMMNRISIHRFGPVEERRGDKTRMIVAGSDLQALFSDADDPRADAASVFAAVGIGPHEMRTNIVKTVEYEGRERTNRIGTVKTIPELGWAIAVDRPVEEAYGVLASVRAAFYSVIGIVAVAAALLGAWIARRTTRPIRSLVELTKHYATRRFEIKSEVRTGDELEQLGSAMETMASSLVAREAEVHRRLLIEASMARYLPREVATEIANGAGDLVLSGGRREVTVLFADVVGFTSFAAKASPEDVASFLNELFSVLSEVVFRHGGMIDKFIGDSLMALFGATKDTVGNDARRAVLAALDMHEHASSVAPFWGTRYGLEVKLAIGVVRGEVVVGNLGTKERLDFTAVGDAVNVAARLEAMAGSRQTLTTRALVEAVGAGPFAFRSVGQHVLRGKDEPIELFEVVEE